MSQEIHLTPTEDLAVEALLARHRLQDTPYAFESRHLRTFKSLAAKGLATLMHGMVENSLRASPTQLCLDTYLSSTHVPPALSPDCRSFTFSADHGWMRIDCERRNHHKGKHRYRWGGNKTLAPVRWADQEAEAAKDAMFAHREAWLRGEDPAPTGVSVAVATVSPDRTWSDEEHPTVGATPATPQCRHFGHRPGDWFYSCCACSGLPGGCDACRTED